MYRDFPALFLSLVIPVGLTFTIMMLNADYDFETVDLNMLMFRWYTIFHIVWGISAIVITLFYIEMILVRRHWGYLLGIPLQFGACVLIWMFSLFNGQIIVHDTFDIDDKTYQLIEVTYNATGLLHVFECEQSICDVEQIAFVDSSRFSGAGMSYDESTHAFNIWADDGVEIEEFTYPLHIDDSKRG